MKKMSKFLAVLLALVLCVSLVPAVFATSASGGSITVNNAIPGQTYKFYRVLDLAVTEGHEEGGETGYLYTVNEAWKDFFKSLGGPGLEYVDVHEGGYVTWKENVGSDAATAQKFAQAALDYATQNSIAAVRTHDTTASTEGNPSDRTSFTEGGLPMGYYLIDSSAGSLVTLNTSDPNVVVNDKNATPDINKEVQEDSTDRWGEVNTADTNQVVNFQSAVTMYSGSDKPYIVHDKMKNLTFTGVTSISLNGEKLEPAATYYTVTTEGLNDDCTFEITFTEAFKEKLKGADGETPTENSVLIEYTATLNEGAYSSKGENDIQLEWGDENTTVWHHTDTYTGKLSIHKYDGDSDANLAGVTFTLTRQGKDAEGNAITEYAVVGADGYVKGWVPAVDGDDPIPKEFGALTGNVILTTGADGIINVYGLDEDTYTITEVEALPGYNPLEDTITAKVEIDEANDGAVTVTYKNTKDTGDAGTAEDGVIPVPNYTGARLPSTGGIGTTIFYVIGGVLVVAAVVLLITKKRMTNRD